MWLNLALPKVSKEISIYVAPPITIGKSNEHTGFPGTLIISGRILRRLLRTIARQLSRWGFRNLAVINTHGGNDSVLRYTLREIQVDFGMRTFVVPLGWTPPLSRQEEAYGFHANEMETSCMLEAAPDLVDMSKAVCEYPADVDDPGELQPEDAPVTFAWKTKDLSESGVIGDATSASAEKGRQWVVQYAESLACQIEKVYMMIG
jgi:creatinine amidohydrolase